MPSQTEREVLSVGPDLDRRLKLLRAAWATFDDVVARIAAELLSSGRGGGRDRETIIRHVIAHDPEQFSRRIEVRTPSDVVLTADGLARQRAAYIDAFRAYNAEGKPARTWPFQFLIRRTAHHVMDHAWEMADRDPGPAAQ